MPTEIHDQNYTLLTGHHRTDGSYKTSEQLRMDYLKRTDGLIFAMTHGVDIHNPIENKTEKQIPDAVIFLDKSARPLAWLVRELWDRAAICDNGEIAKKPEMYFLNIDREQWINSLDPNGNGQLDVARIDKSIIRSLRSIFVAPTDKKEGLTEEIDSVPASLDNKTILVVDEVYSTGRTLSMATDFIRAAFPTSFVAGIHWMSGVASRNLASGNADLPVWYKQDDPRGRGVNDRMKNPVGQHTNTTTQQLGAWFLSTRFSTPDEASLLLRRELKQLAHDPEVPYKISPDRYDISTEEGMEAYVEHISRVNFGKEALKVLAIYSKIFTTKQ